MPKKYEEKKEIKHDDDMFFGQTSVASATDCTGLMPTPPISDSEADSYTKIYDIPYPMHEVNNGFQNEKVN